jgi:hypothetical protein
MADTAAAPAENGTKFETITLADPIRRGEQVIEKIALRKPRGGELRGLTLQELINTDIGAILKVVPRISDPVLTPHECDNLDPADLAEIGGTIRGFFMTAAEREVMQAMIAEQRRKI